MLSRIKKLRPIQLANLNSIWNGFVVRDNSPRINNSRYALSNMNKFFRAQKI